MRELTAPRRVLHRPPTAPNVPTAHTAPRGRLDQVTARQARCNHRPGRRRALTVRLGHTSRQRARPLATIARPAPTVTMAPPHPSRVLRARSVPSTASAQRTSAPFARREQAALQAARRRSPACLAPCSRSMGRALAISAALAPSRPAAARRRATHARWAPIASREPQPPCRVPVAAIRTRRSQCWALQ